MEKEIKTLQDALKESRENRKKFIQEQMERQKKQEKKETILAIIIGLFILVLTMCLLHSMNENDLKRCIASGNSENYCISGL